MKIFEVLQENSGKENTPTAKLKKPGEKKFKISRPDRPTSRRGREERKSRLSEAVSRTHMTHLEDLVFYQGYNGAKQALNYLASVTDMLSGNSNKRAKVTTKWDGAPAIIAGTDPKDGKFFVTTKHAMFAKTPRLSKTPKDIEKNHPDVMKGDELVSKQGLRDKFKTALKELKKLNFDGILHGDFMFSKNDLKEQTIDGENYIIFKPQEITYAVPADSDLAKDILAADIGIVWHTQYTGGPEIEDMTTQYGVVAPQGNKKVWSEDATYKDLTGIATLTANETNIVKNGVEKLANIITKISPGKFNAVMKNKEFIKYIEPFINQKIRAGEAQVENPTAFLKEFMDYYDDRMQAEIDKLKTGIEGPSGQARVQKIEANKKFIEDNSNILLAILGVYKQIIQLKQILIGKLSKVEGIGTFYETESGYEVADPEGFVAIDRIGNAVKLVDRLEFSRRNFLAKKGWS